MIKIRKSEDRGHFDHGWLDTYHTFSFADYQDPDFMGFSKLRVINQDRVQPGQGFGTHSHRNMEIISYVLDGVLEHKDSMGNGSRIVPGDVQFMSAGTGVTHSEFNGSDKEVAHFLQIWVLPAQMETKPAYGQKSYPREGREGRLQLMVSPDGREGSIRIGQDVSMYGGLLDAGQEIEHPIGSGRAGWIHVARGRLRMNGAELGAGDGASIQDETALRLDQGEEAEFLLFDLP